MKLSLSLILAVVALSGSTSASTFMGHCKDYIVAFDAAQCTRNAGLESGICVFNPADITCGWGKKRHEFENCNGVPTERSCDFDCHKTCAGDPALSNCKDLNLNDYNSDIKSPCTHVCGVGTMIWRYVKDLFVNLECKWDCCCKRCPGLGLGASGPRRCTDDLLAAIPVSLRPVCCPWTEFP